MHQVLVSILIIEHAASSSVQYADRGPLTPAKSRAIAYFDLTDQMHWEMDIEIHSLPSSNWANILRGGVGGTNGANPSVFLHPTAGDDDATYKGFWVRYPSGTGSSSEGVAVGNAVVIGETYHLEFDFTQTWLRIMIDGHTVYDSAKATHETHDSVRLYLSGWSYDAADVTVSNLVVSSVARCDLEGAADCEQYSVCDVETGSCSRSCDTAHVDAFLMSCALKSIEDRMTELQASSALAGPNHVDGTAIFDADSRWMVTGTGAVILALLATNILSAITIVICARRNRVERPSKYVPVSVVTESENENLQIQ